MGRVREEKGRRKKIKEEKARRKKIQVREKVRKSRNTVFFGPLLEVAMSKKCTPLWRKARSQVKMYKTHHARTTFGGSDVEKVHAVAARSTFPGQNAKSTTCSDHFEGSDVVFAWQAQGIAHLAKSEQRVRVL